MDLRQLEYIVAVADRGSFTAGAALAHVAQPSLSARVADLERELGVALFDRLGRRVQLTSAGAVVVDHARGVLADVAGLRAAAADVAGAMAGTLTLAALPTLAVDPLAPLVGRFHGGHPAVTVRLVDADDAGGSGGVAGLVRSGQAEVGALELPAATRDLMSVPIGDQELFAIGAAAGAEPPRRSRPAGAAAGSGVTPRRRTLRNLAASPLVLTPPGTSTRRVVDAAFAAMGLSPAVAVEVAQREAIVPLVLSGAGIGFVPGAQAESARAQGASVWAVEPPLRRHIGLVHRSGRLSPAARAFVAEVTAGGDQPKRPVM